MANFEVILRGRSVNVRYTHHGNFPIPTGYEVDPALFTGKHGQWVKGDLVMNGKINKKLSELQERATKYFADYDEHPTADQFKAYIKTGKRKVITFDSAWAEFVQMKTHQGHKSVGVARKQKYDLVKRYMSEMSPGLTLQSIDIKWAARWVDWLMKEKGAKQNYVCALSNVTISFLHYCDDNKIIEVPKKTFKALRQDEEDLDIPFHPIEELRAMLKKDLSKYPDLEDTRNKYCLQCMLGMRVSDLFTCAWDMKQDLIKKAAIKTREDITIPLRTEAKELIRKMLTREGGYREIHETVYNKEIKEVGELCGLDHWVTMVHGKRQFKAGEKYHKYLLMSSHMARATFICQMIELDVHYKKIMAMTGIKDVNTLKKYAAVMDVTLVETMAMVEEKQALIAKPKTGELQIASK